MLLASLFVLALPPFLQLVQFPLIVCGTSCTLAQVPSALLLASVSSVTRGIDFPLLAVIRCLLGRVFCADFASGDLAVLYQLLASYRSALYIRGRAVFDGEMLEDLGPYVPCVADRVSSRSFSQAFVFLHAFFGHAERVIYPCSPCHLFATRDQSICDVLTSSRSVHFSFHFQASRMLCVPYSRVSLAPNSTLRTLRPCCLLVPLVGAFSATFAACLRSSTGFLILAIFVVLIIFGISHPTCTCTFSVVLMTRPGIGWSTVSSLNSANRLLPSRQLLSRVSGIQCQCGK